MASIGGLTSGTGSQLYGASVHGYTGLASGMDIDSMIEKMTYGTRTKISKQLQGKQTLQWQQAAYRSISDKLIAFNQKYLSVTSSGSLYRAGSFRPSIFTSNGANGSKVSVSGTSDILKTMAITKVNSLASTARYTSDGVSSLKELATGEINFDEPVITSKLAGESFTFKYAGKDYNLHLDASKDYSTVEAAVTSINEQLSKVTVTDPTGRGDVKNLGDVVNFTYDEAEGKFSFEKKAVNDGGAELGLTGISKKGMEVLGFQEDQLKENNLQRGTPLTAVDAKNVDDIRDSISLSDHLAGKKISFSLDGKTKTITLPGAEELTDMNQLQKAIQDGMDSAFGKDAVTVGLNSGDGGTTGNLTFTTRNDTSVLTVGSADNGLLGKSGVLGMNSGQMNRINTGKGLLDAGFGLTEADLAGYQDASGEIQLEINGVAITGITKNSSVAEIMEKINSSDAGVKMSYLATADKFTITSTASGAQGKIEFGDKTAGGGDNFAAYLFGDRGTGTLANVSETGTDAEFTVRYGEDGTEVTMKRDSNSFEMDGSKFTLNGTFTDGEAITFTGSVDTESLAKNVSEMVNAYNELIEEVGKQTGTRPDREYFPLTSEQKKDMSEDEIKEWETKAKVGAVYNDSILNSLSNDLRFVFTGVADAGVLEKIGLTISDDYTENGKITFDEAKFKSAMETDSSQIEKMFTKDASGTDKGGFMARMESVYTKYAKTIGTKGSLIDKAGSLSSPASITENTVQKEINNIDKYIAELKARLQSEIDRYNAQFTRLEQVISQMNSQSSMFGSV